MNFVTRNLFEDITVWVAGTTDIYGNPTWSSPSTIKGRWEDKQVKAVDARGDEIISQAVVYVDTDVALGDYIYQGVSTATSPPVSAKEVRNFSKIPSLKGNIYQRKVIL